MASNTPNMGLTKADGTDLANLATHITGNWDIIDAKLDASATGDLEFNKFTAAVAQAWTPSNFTVSGGAVSRKIELVTNNTVIFWYRAAIGSVSGTMGLTLPYSFAWNSTARIIGDVMAWDASANTGVLAPAIQVSATQIQFANTLGTGLFNATAPFTWASGDVLSVVGILERA